jgi:hypothetical protein
LLFLCLKDDLLSFHVIENFISLECLTHRHCFVGHKAADECQSPAISNGEEYLLEQVLLLLQLFQSLWENACATYASACDIGLFDSEV